MSLLVAAACVGGGVLAARWLARAIRRSAAPELPAAPPAPESPQFPLKLGDVVVRGSHDEAWLAGAIVFSEETATAALFIAPDAGGDRAIWARTLPSRAIVWLEPVAKGALEVGREPPGAIEIEGTRFERVRRLPLRARRIGSGAPDVGERAIVGEYESGSGERLVVIVGSSGALAWRGVELGDGMYEVLGSSSPE